jgi:hypothetical protein
MSTSGGDTSVRKDGHISMTSEEPPQGEDSTRALEGEGFAQRLVTAVESLRPGTRQLSPGQQTVLAEYEHIVEQLRPPTFSPPPPEISQFRTDGRTLRIFGRHLHQAITVTIAGVRVPSFDVRDAEEDEPPYLEMVVPDEVEAGPIVVLTSGGSSIGARQFRPSPADDEPRASWESS